MTGREQGDSLNNLAPSSKQATNDPLLVIATYTIVYRITANGNNLCHIAQQSGPNSNHLQKKH